MGQAAELADLLMKRADLVLDLDRVADDPDIFHQIIDVDILIRHFRIEFAGLNLDRSDPTRLLMNFVVASQNLAGALAGDLRRRADEDVARDAPFAAVRGPSGRLRTLFDRFPMARQIRSRTGQRSTSDCSPVRRRP